MNSLFENLVHIIEKQELLYSDFLELEKQKTDLISQNRNTELESLVSEQEKILRRIDLSEAGRISSVDKISAAFYVNRANPSLRDISQYAAGAVRKRITAHADRLKSVTVELQRILELNSRMLKDNLNFYSMFIDGIKDSLDDKNAYYSGKETKTRKTPVLINRTV